MQFTMQRDRTQSRAKQLAWREEGTGAKWISRAASSPRTVGIGSTALISAKKSGALLRERRSAKHTLWVPSIPSVAWQP
jgi:hypothetical protein